MRIAVIIPCYKVKKHILSVLEKIGPEVSGIFVVDDKCPDNSGQHVEKHSADPRVRVIYNSINLGVGGATMAGYHEAFMQKFDIAIKLDGDGQMDPSLIPAIAKPILKEVADYSKGNRFFYLEDLRKMPIIRLVGNATLSFFSKFSSGYYQIFDPTNGYTALKLSLLPLLYTEKISKRYFFESDLLFRLNLANAHVVDVPMMALYGDEESNLKISKILVPFIIGHSKNFLKRLLYKYYVRDFSIASLELVFGLILFFSGISFGIFEWVKNSMNEQVTPAGTVALALLPIILGFQLLLAFLNYDMSQSNQNTRG